MILCDLGADVIKVERPPIGDVARMTPPIVKGESCYFMSVNRGKRSIAIDLKNEAGRELFLRLVERADVVMENFTPDTMDALGLGYDVLSQRNPRLIYAATSGFGQTGPDRLRPALDIIAQGMGGIMSITGEPGGPPVRPGASLGDIAAGLFTAIGVLAALHERERSGRGQMVDVAMLDCQVAILENAFARYFATGECWGPSARGTRWLHRSRPSHPRRLHGPRPDLGVENQWSSSAPPRRPSSSDPRFDTGPLRTEHHAELEPILNEALKQKATAEWVREFDAIGLPCGPLNNVAQAAALPQVRAREMLVEVEHPQVGRSPPNTPVNIETLAASGALAGPFLGRVRNATCRHPLPPRDMNVGGRNVG
jgi:CoA:oxalate CoA-transferase